MAARLEKAFGADPDDLMSRQAEYDSSKRADNQIISATTRMFVPSFLQIRADDIEQWANSSDSRSTLPVLLRDLDQFDLWRIEIR